jgi:hypothetical protein
VGIILQYLHTRPVFAVVAVVIEVRPIGYIYPDATALCDTENNTTLDTLIPGSRRQPRPVTLAPTTRRWCVCGRIGPIQSW